MTNERYEPVFYCDGKQAVKHLVLVGHNNVALCGRRVDFAVREYGFYYEHDLPVEVECDSCAAAEKIWGKKTEAPVAKPGMKIFVLEEKEGKDTAWNPSGHWFPRAYCASYDEACLQRTIAMKERFGEKAETTTNEWFQIKERVLK